MAHENTWSSLEDGQPTGANLLGQVDDFIRQTRQMVRERIALEHDFNFLINDQQGYHRQGSARVWVSDTQPTSPIPDPTSTETSGSETIGRCWFKPSTGEYFVYDNASASWIPVNLTTLQMAALLHAMTAKASLDDDDEFALADSEATYGPKKTLWSTIKSVIKTALSIGGSHALSEDDIADGTSYKRVQAAKADKINGDTYSEDDIADGTTYKRLLAAEATQMRASASSPWSTPPTLYFKDSLRAQIEFASGGQQTVLYDDVGIPSVMQWIPAFNLQDIHADLGTGLHPAFVVNGTAKAGIWIGVYQAKVSGGRAYSWPGQDPTASVNFDTAKGYCTAKGAGWHMMTAWEWGAVALWCLKNGFQPRGNTSCGRSHANTFEAGTRSDGYPPGSTSGAARIKTGSGPASWRHNNAFFGIADLVGNVAEWLDGYKTVDGRMYFPNDNDFTLAESSWPAQDAYWDGTVSGAAGDPKLSDTTPANQTTDSYYNSITGEAGWRSLTYSTDYFDSMPLALRQKLAAMLIAPAVTSSTPLFAASGAVYNRNNGERFLFRGGYWGNGANAGLAYLYLGYLRSTEDRAVGFRLAYSS